MENQTVEILKKNYELAKDAYEKAMKQEMESKNAEILNLKISRGKWLALIEYYKIASRYRDAKVSHWIYELENFIK